MNPSTWAGVITAIGVFMTALVGVVGAVSNWRATTRAVDKVRAVEIGVERVHQVVNSRLTALLDRQEVLISRLQEHGIDVPPRAPEG